MCEEFNCIHQQYGICNFDDAECEGESCVNFGDCGQCENEGIVCFDECGEER